MRATLRGVDIVGVGIDILLVFSVVLHRYFDTDAITLSRDKYRLRKDRALCFINKGNEASDSTLEVEILLLVRALVDQLNSKSCVKKRHLSYAVRYGVVVKAFLFEKDRMIRIEGYLGSSSGSFSNNLERLNRISATKLNRVQLSVLLNLCS